jgi:hypothetical protein
MISYHVEQRKLEQLQREFRCWLETKEDIVRLADRRDQLLALLNAKYGYCAEAAAEAGEASAAESLHLSSPY